MQINDLPKPTARLVELKKELDKITSMIQKVGLYDLRTEANLVAQLPASLEYVHSRLCEFIEFTREVQNHDVLETYESLVIHLWFLHHEIVNKIFYFMDLVHLNEELRTALENVSTNDLATKVTVIEAKCAWLIEKYKP